MLISKRRRKRWQLLGREDVTLGNPKTGRAAVGDVLEVAGSAAVSAVLSAPKPCCSSASAVGRRSPADRVRATPGGVPGYGPFSEVRPRRALYSSVHPRNGPNERKPAAALPPLPFAGSRAGEPFWRSAGPSGPWRPPRRGALDLNLTACAPQRFRQREPYGIRSWPLVIEFIWRCGRAGGGKLEASTRNETWVKLSTCCTDCGDLSITQQRANAQDRDSWFRQSTRDNRWSGSLARWFRSSPSRAPR